MLQFATKLQVEKQSSNQSREWVSRVLLLPALLILVAAGSAVATRALAGPAEYGLRHKPVMFFRLEESPTADTGCFKDATGNTPGGTVKNSAKGLPRMIGGASDWAGHGLDFSATEACVEAPASTATFALGDMARTDGMSVSFWIKTRWHIDDNNRRVLGYGNVFEVTPSKNDGGNLVFALCGAQTTFPAAVAHALMNDTWHHVGVAIDFKRDHDNFRLYLDGSRVGTSSGFFQSAIQNRRNGGLVIGARTNGSQDFNGALDEVALFDRFLDDSEMAALHAGPVFAGLPQTVVLPVNGELRGWVPSDAPSLWSQRRGPGTALIASPEKPSSTVTLPMPGNYVFVLKTREGESETVVEAKAATPPVVYAGNNQRVIGERRVKLEGSITQAGVSDPSVFRLAWSKVEGPGEVRFDSAEKADPTVTFTADGRYVLRLSATNGNLSGQGDVSILCNPQSVKSMHMLFKPLISMPLNDPAQCVPEPIADETGNTAYLVPNHAHGLP